VCGRFSQHYTWQEIHDGFDLVRPAAPRNLEPRYNIAPTQTVDVVRAADSGNELVHMRWDLVPFFWKKPLKDKKFSTFNARAETLATANSFRAAFRHRRCIVPVSGFYEWRRPKQKGQPPVYFSSADGTPLALAGLWDQWVDPGSGDPLLSCTIVTTEPNAMVKPLHNRMPVILTRSEAETWMRTDPDHAADLRALLRPCSPDLMSSRQVSAFVNSTRNEGPGCIAEAD